VPARSVTSLPSRIECRDSSTLQQNKQATGKQSQLTTMSSSEPSKETGTTTTTSTTDEETTTISPSIDGGATAPPPAAVPPKDGPPGCYLVYEPSSGGRLMLHYSKGPVPHNDASDHHHQTANNNNNTQTAVGFWMPGPEQSIQEFKFKQNMGRAELIKGIAGGDANRRKYYSGWCQFIKLAKQKEGRVIQFSPQRATTTSSSSNTDSSAVQQQQPQLFVDVDVYGMRDCSSPEQLLLQQGLCDISQYEAVAVVPKHADFLRGVKTIPIHQFLEMGNIAGAATKLT
jgi:hypothetical protein